MEPKVSPRVRTIQAAIILTPLAYGTVHPLPVALFQVAAYVVFGFWLVERWQRTGTWHHARSPLLLIGFAAVSLGLFQLVPLPHWLVGWLSPGTHRWGHAGLETVGIDPGSWLSLAVVPWATQQGTLWLGALVCWFAVIQDEAGDPRTARRIVRTMAFTAIALASLGLLQYFTGATAIFWIGAEHPNFHASLVNPNNAAGLLTLGTMAILAITLTTSPERRALWTLGAVVTAGSAVLSLSRGGIGILFFSLAILGWLTLTKGAQGEQKKLWFRAAPVGFGVVLLAFVAWVGYTDVVGELRTVHGDTELNGRVPVWIDAVTSMSPDFPIFGIGYGNFEAVYPAYQSQAASVRYTAVENEYLHALLEGGLIGALLALSALTIILRRVHGLFTGRRHLGLSAPMAAGLLGILSHMMLDFPLHVGGPALWIVATAAIVMGRSTSGREPRQQHQPGHLSGPGPTAATTGP